MIMNHPFTSSAQIVVILEAQMGPHSTIPYYETLMLGVASGVRYPKVLFVTSKGSNKQIIYGVSLDHDGKQRYLDTFRSLLMNDKVHRMDPNVICITHIKGGHAAAYHIVETQLRFYKKRFAKQKNGESSIFSVVKTTFSGKGNNQKDDVAMAIQTGAYLAHDCLTNVEMLQNLNGQRLVHMVGLQYNLRAQKRLGEFAAHPEDQHMIYQVNRRRTVQSTQG